MDSEHDDDVEQYSDDAERIVGDNQANRINAGGGDDFIYSRGGNDAINGEAGDDSIWGGEGDDTLTGGEGDDTFYFQAGWTGSSTITDFTTNEDVIDLRSFRTITSLDDLTMSQSGDDVLIDLTAQGGGTVRLEGVTLESLTANQFNFYEGFTQYGDTNNRIRGSHREDDHIKAGGGEDTVVGLGGNDTIEGEGGNDALLGSGGDDSLDGGAGDDYLSGGDDNDTIDGGGDDDFIWGGQGNDSMTGGDGADTFHFRPGETGTDTIVDFNTAEDAIDLSRLSKLSSFTDLSMSQDGDDVLIDLTGQGGGTIRLEGVTLSSLTADHFEFRENLHVVGTDGDEMLTGEAGDDHIEGHGGSDRLLGRDGDDTLDGGSGSNTHFGGGGADTFVIQPGDVNSLDLIGDFNNGEDIIDLTAFTDIAGFDDLTVSFNEISSLITIDLRAYGGGKVQLSTYSDADITMETLDEADFRFSESTTESSPDDSM